MPHPLSRRQLVQGMGAVGLGLLAGCGRWPGQAPVPVKVPRLGFLLAGSPTPDPASGGGLQQGLQEHGYVEGQNLIIERRYADGQAARLHELAAELAALPVDVILTAGTFTAEAARAATSALPIVMVYPGDPVAAGLITSLAHPGGNVTGVTEYQPQLAAKRLELLKETAPGISRVAVPTDPDAPAAPLQSASPLQTAAQILGVQLLRLDVRTPDDLDAALEAGTHAGADAVLWGGGRDFRSPEYRGRLAMLAAQHRLPTICGFLEWAQAGVLLAYAPNYPAQFRRTAYYIDRILKGTKPADLPVEQPMRFDFVINLQTAQALGLTISPHVLLQATEVIQ